MEQERWTTIQVSKFLTDPATGLIGEALVNPADKAKMLEIAQAVVEKAAKLTAACITASVLQSGAGIGKEKPVALNIDGTTYYQTKGLKEAVERYLQQYLEGRYRRFIRLLHVEDAPTIGAAIAGLSE